MPTFIVHDLYLTYTFPTQYKHVPSHFICWVKSSDHVSYVSILTYFVLMQWKDRRISGYEIWIALNWFLVKKTKQKKQLIIQPLSSFRQMRQAGRSWMNRRSRGQIYMKRRYPASREACRKLTRNNLSPNPKLCRYIQHARSRVTSKYTSRRGNWKKKRQKP